MVGIDSFTQFACGLGISNHHTVVLYDDPGALWATRLWWVFRYYGHFRATVLDGGMQACAAAGYPIHRGDTRYAFLPAEDIANALQEVGLNTGKQTITYCQAGVRAAFCTFVLELSGHPIPRFYDASMAEWVNCPDTPLARKD